MGTSPFLNVSQTPGNRKAVVSFPLRSGHAQDPGSADVSLQARKTPTSPLGGCPAGGVPAAGRGPAFQFHLTGCVTPTHIRDRVCLTASAAPSADLVLQNRSRTRPEARAAPGLGPSWPAPSRFRSRLLFRRTGRRWCLCGRRGLSPSLSCSGLHPACPGGLWLPPSANS